MTKTQQESQIAGVMFTLSSRPLGRAALALALWLALGAPAQAAMERPWNIQYNSSLEATTNLQQIDGGTPDFALRNSLEFSYYPTSESDNSTLFRLQALNSRYVYNPEYNSTILVATALASRRLVNNTYGFGGYQFIFKQADAPSNISRQDNDLFLGAVNYSVLSPTRVVSHGYQFDFLRAAVPTYSYQGHSGFLTWREVMTDRWVNSASLRTQWRLYDVLGALEWRNLAIAESSYAFTSWFRLRGEVIFVNASASRQDLTFNGWNFGVFSQFVL